MLRVWEDTHFRVGIDYPTKLVLVARTLTPFASTADIPRAFDRLEHELRRYTLDAPVLLIDTRDTPPLDPSAIEAVCVALRKLVSRYRLSAALAGTTLHERSQRIRAIVAPGYLVTSSPAEACAHLGIPFLDALLLRAA